MTILYENESLKCEFQNVLISTTATHQPHSQDPELQQYDPG